MNVKIDGVDVYTNVEMPFAEAKYYLDFIRRKYPHASIVTMNVSVDGDEVLLEVFKRAVPFERIRRITGYLVGTLDRFNDAKKAEVLDRVKHDV